MPAERAIYFACINFFIFFNDFSETSYLKIRWTDFRNLFHRMKAYWVQMIDLDLFLIPQGTLPWQPIKVKKIDVFYGPIYFLALPFRNGLQYGNNDFKRLDRMNFSTLCTILVTLGPAAPKFTLLTIAPFAAIRQTLAYHANYLKISWTYVDLLYRFGRRISGDDFPSIRLAVAQRMLLWQPVKMGDVRQCRVEWPLLFASAFDDGLADRKSAFKRLNGNNQATSKFGMLMRLHPLDPSNQ